MLKVNRYILKYLIYSFPVVLGIIVFWQLTPDKSMFNPYTPEQPLLYTLYYFLPWYVGLYFIISLYFPLALIFSPQFRELVLTTLARIKERDERESYITGHSSRFAFLSTQALLILLLLFNSLHISHTKAPPGSSYKVLRVSVA